MLLRLVPAGGEDLFELVHHDDQPWAAGVGDEPGRITRVAAQGRLDAAALRRIPGAGWIGAGWIGGGGSVLAHRPGDRCADRCARSAAGSSAAPSAAVPSTVALCSLASCRASSPRGVAPGVNSANLRWDPSGSAGISPARSNDDFPEPEGPTTVSGTPGGRSLGGQPDQARGDGFAAEEPGGVLRLETGQAPVGRRGGGRPPSGPAADPVESAHPLAQLGRVRLATDPEDPGQ